MENGNKITPEIPLFTHREHYELKGSLVSVEEKCWALNQHNSKKSWN